MITKTTSCYEIYNNCASYKEYALFAYYVINISENKICQGVKQILDSRDMRNKFSSSHHTERDYKKDINNFLLLD